MAAVKRGFVGLTPGTRGRRIIELDTGEVLIKHEAWNLVVLRTLMR